MSGGGELERVRVLARALRDAESEVGRLEGELAVAKATTRRLSTEDLPELMRELEMTEFAMEDGFRVKVEEAITASITEANRERAHAWLEENGYGGLIKTSVAVAFGRDERDEALALATRLADEEAPRGHSVALAESVHPSTLKAFVRERQREGELPPADLFSLHVFSLAKVGK